MSQKRWPWEAQGVLAARKEIQARRSHQANRWLTIFLPLLAAGGGLTAVAIWAIAGASSSTASKAADAVVIWMTLVCMISALPVLALLIALAVVTTRAQRHVPDLTKQILQALRLTRQTLKQVSDKTARPFIRWQATLAAWRAAWQTLRKGGRA